MRERMKLWLNRTKISDPLEQQQAPLVQLIMLLVIAVFTLTLPLVVTGAATPLNRVLATISSLAIIVFALFAIVLLRNGRFRRAILLLALGFSPGQLITLASTGLANSPVVLIFAIPMTLVGLLSGRRSLIAIVALSIVTVAVAEIIRPSVQAVLKTALPAMEGMPVIVIITVIMAVIGFLFERFGNMVRDALYLSRAREQELAQMQSVLEQRVAERTADLQVALNEGQQRETQLVEALAENKRQQQTIQALSTPVLPIRDDTLVMPLVGVLDAERLDMLQQQALRALEQSKIRHLVLDITGVPFVDSYIAQGLIKIVQSARLLGVDVMLVGIHPEVAQALVGLGVDLSELRTVSNLQAAIQVLARGA